MLLETGVVVSVLLVGLYVWLTWNYSYWKKKGIVQVEPSLIFGNIANLILMRENFAITYDKLYNVYPEEPAVGLYKMRQPQLLIRDFHLAKTALVKEFSSFHDNDMDIDTSADPVVSLNPFFTKGEKWKAVRSISTAALTVSKLKNMMEHMKTVCKDLVEYLKEKEGEFMEAKNLGALFTADVVIGCVYGLEDSSFKNPDNVYKKHISEMFNPGSLTNALLTIASIVPSVAKIFRIRFLKKSVSDFFIEMVSKAVEYRKQTQYERDDFLQHLISQKDKNGQPLFSMTEICGHSLTFVLDGYETSSLLICHVLDMLSKHPEVQVKLREEIRSKIPSIDDISFNLIHSLPYLEAVLDETLRLRPPGSVLFKYCTKDVELESQGRTYRLKKGDLACIPIFSIQKDPKYFEDPDSFRPERFLRGPLDGFLPFGLGPRTCLGQRFALSQVKCFVAAVVSQFDILPKETKNTPPVFDPSSFVLLYIKGGVSVKFSKAPN